LLADILHRMEQHQNNRRGLLGSLPAWGNAFAVDVADGESRDQARPNYEPA
jgi:hypothetical protein